MTIESFSSLLYSHIQLTQVISGKQLPKLRANIESLIYKESSEQVS